MKVSLSDKIDRWEIRYDLNNENENAIHREFQKYRNITDEYFQGKVTAKDALRFLERGLRKYTAPVGVAVGNKQVFNVIYHIAISEKIQALIDEIKGESTAETQPVEAGGLGDNKITIEEIDAAKNNTLAILMRENLIETISYKDTGMYRMTKTSNIPSIMTILKVKIQMEQIKHLEIDQIEVFIKSNIIDKKGNNLSNAISVAKNRNKKTAKK